MPVIKAEGIEAFMMRRPPETAIVLLYGSYQSSVHELAERLVAKVTGGADDPFASVNLDGQLLVGDMGRLIDEVQSLSLLGQSRVVWVRGVDQNFLRAAEPILDGAISGNLVIAEAGNLAKTSALRTRFETSKHAAVVPVYETGDGDATRLLPATFRSLGLSISLDAATRLVQLAGRNPSVLRRESEKLAAYCRGREAVEIGR